MHWVICLAQNNEYIITKCEVGYFLPVKVVVGMMVVNGRCLGF